MSSRRTNDIKVLSEQLGSLQITEEVSSEYEQMNTKMSAVPVPAISNENVQTGIPKNMVLDPDLKTSGGRLDYSSRVTGSWRLMTGS